MALAEVIFVIFFWLSYQHPEFRKPLNLLEKIFLVFILALFVSLFFGADPTLSFWSSFDRMTGVLMWLHLFGVFLVISRVLRQEHDWHQFFLVTTIVGSVISLFHFLSFFYDGGHFFIQKASTIGNSTFFGVYLLFHIFLSFLLMTSRKDWLRTYAIFAMVVFLLAIFTSEAQAVIWSFIGSLVLLGALFLIISVNDRKKSYFGFTVLAILAVFFLFAFVSLFKSGSWLQEIIAERASGARFVVWDIAWQGIKERPIVGWGSENFSSVFFKYYNPCIGSPSCGVGMFDRAHNKVLDMWIESGIVGLLLYLSLFVVLFIGLWRRYIHQHDIGVKCAIVTAGLAAYFVQNIINLDVSVTYLFWIILLAYGSTLAFPIADRKEPKHKQHFYYLSIATILIPIAFFFFVLQPLRGNLAISQWFLATNSSERLSSYERAISLSPVSHEARRWYLARQSAGGAWIEQIKGRPIPSDTQKELLIVEKGLVDSTKNGSSLFSYLHLGLVYHTQAKFFEANKFSDAEQILQLAVARNPNNQQPLWALAAVYLEQGKIPKALEMTERAVRLNPKVGQSHMQRLIAAKFAGDKKLIDQYAAEAIAVSPSSQAYVNLILAADLKKKKDQLIFELY